MKYRVPPNDLHRLTKCQKIKIALMVFKFRQPPSPYLLKIALIQSVLLFVSLTSLPNPIYLDPLILPIFWVGSLAGSVTIYEMVRIFA